MSQSNLSNTQLKFSTVSGGSETIKSLIKTATNEIIFEGSSGATACTLSNIANPTANSHAVNKAYLDTQIASNINGLSWKKSARAKTTANLVGTLVGNVFSMTANGQLTIDNVLLVLNDRVVVANQTAQAQNGLYFISTQGDGRAGQEAPAVLTRSTDADSVAELESAAVFIEEGAVAANTAYVQTSDNITLNTSNVIWNQFSSVGEVLAGAGLSKSGNTLSASVDNTTIEVSAGNLAIKSNSIGASQIGTNVITGSEVQDASLTDAELADSACVTRVINNSAVTTDKLATNAVTSAKVLNANITADKLATNAVTSAKILDANVTELKLADNAVTSDKIASAAVTSSKLASGAVLTVSIGAAQVATSNIIDSNITAQKIASNAITSSKIASANVITDKLANNAVTEAKIAALQISTGLMKDDAVTQAKLADNSVGSDQIINGSVGGSKLGTLNGLTVNGIVNATAFIAGGSGSSDGGFALPKAKSLSIDFNQNFAISSDNQFHTVGGNTDLAAVQFTYDDNITMSIAFSTFMIQHTGENGGVITPNYEISYYNGAQVAQAYGDVSGAPRDFDLSSASATDYQLNSDAVLGDGSTRIAKIRLRLKSSHGSDTLVVKDSMQLTCFAIDDTSGNVNRTYANNALS